MLWLLIAARLAFAAAPVEKAEIAGRIESARASISESEKKQREALSHLFVINQRIKDIAKKSARVNERMMAFEADVRALAQDVDRLQSKSEQHKHLLNKRLRQLYHDRRADSLQWLFSAQTPVEMERVRRYLRLMIDSDHRQIKLYLASLRELREKRGRLKGMVMQLARLQREVRVRESDLTREMRDKSRLVVRLKRMKDSKLSELKDLRHSHRELDLSYAFFERRGSLRPPVEGRLAREYGTLVDRVFGFRMMHKGLFFSVPAGAEVHSVSSGRVALAAEVPGFGRTVMVDHGDNYYSVYTFCSQLKVKEGAQVADGTLLALSGAGSPLFGPGLYFEIRHFTDAIDPRPWIKEPGIRTANTDKE